MSDAVSWGTRQDVHFVKAEDATAVYELMHDERLLFSQAVDRLELRHGTHFLMLPADEEAGGV